MIPWLWPAPLDDGGAAHLVRGLALPDIALPTASGGTVSLAGLPGRSILFIYTWTGRPGIPDPPDWDHIAGAHGSTAELQGIRNLQTSFESIDTKIYALSTQTTPWQREATGRLQLGFDLISDHALEFAAALGLPTFQTGGETYLRRITLAIDDGKIDYVFYPVHPPDAHARDVLAWLTDAVGYALEGRINPGMKLQQL